MAAPGSQSRHTGSTTRIINDVRAAVEVQLDEDMWEVVYPGRSLQVSNDFAVLRLREAPEVEVAAATGEELRLRVSEDFRALSVEAKARDAKEAQGAAREAARRKANEERREAAARAEARALRNAKGKRLACQVLLVLAIFLGSVIGIACVKPASGLAAGLLAGGALCCCCGVSLFGVVRGSADESYEMRFGAWAGCVGRLTLLAVGMGFVALVGMTVQHSQLGYWWSSLIVWPISCCWGGFTLLTRCFGAGFLLDDDQLTTLDEERAEAEKEVLNRSIVFKGEVSREPGRECVASWPGKYESAWDSLVASAREGEVSAAVVFLPDGTSDFGRHDQIPPQECLKGECWCVPLYGEEKDWGCRWWTHWIAPWCWVNQHGSLLSAYAIPKPLLCGACIRGVGGRTKRLTA